MKHIIIEGGDRLGKDTLIRGIQDSYEDNWTIRHFGKPPKGLSSKESLDFQFDVFYKESIFVDHIMEELNDEYGYYDNSIIWNRSHLGEYVYAQMFRGIPKKEIKERIKLFEGRNVTPNMYLITLTANSYFFLSKEDGDSFSKSLEQKERELELFKEAHNISIIPHKKIVKVDFEGEFRSKESIINSVINFINGEGE